MLWSVRNSLSFLLFPSHTFHLVWHGDGRGAGIICFVMKNLCLFWPWCPLCCFSLIFAVPSSSDCGIFCSFQLFFPVVPPFWPLVSAMPCNGPVGTSWTWLHLQGRPWSLLTEGTPAALPLPTCWHLQPVEYSRVVEPQNNLNWKRSLEVVWVQPPHSPSHQKGQLYT